MAEIGFDPSLRGEAELVGFTDSFEACQGGEAAYDAATRVLVVTLRLPVKLALTFGPNRS
jgi:hypothetical protein